MPFEGVCHYCNRRRMVAVNRKTGEFCCNNCYIKLFQPRWSCAGCGSVRQARYVTDPAAGTRFCAKCYASQILTATCSECGTSGARIHLRTEDGEAICSGCYHLHHARERRADRMEPTEHQRAALLEMLRIARERGGWCLSAAYEDSQTLLRWRCRHGHEFECPPVSITRGAWCSACAGVARLSIEQMHELAAQRGGECLSSIYKSVAVALRWRCAGGHEFMMRPDSV